jgi:hypothetical protein
MINGFILPSADCFDLSTIKDDPDEQLTDERLFEEIEISEELLSNDLDADELFYDCLLSPVAGNHS